MPGPAAGGHEGAVRESGPSWPPRVTGRVYPGAGSLLTPALQQLFDLRELVERLVFLAESLTDLASRRHVDVYRGVPEHVLAERHPAVTYAPVPGFRRRATAISSKRSPRPPA